MVAPFLSALAGDNEIETLLGDDAGLAAMLDFERALAEAEAGEGLIPPEAATAIAAACAAFVPDRERLAAGMLRDGVLGPSFVAELRATLPEPHRAHLHVGATSQDVVDTALVIRLARVVAVLDARLAGLVAALERLKAAQGAVSLMAQTRMQQALPVTAGDKLDTWIRPLQRDRVRLAEIGPRLLVVQLGGPVGTRAQLQGKGDAVAVSLARRLGLGSGPAWHSARDTMVEFGNWFALVTGTLGKIGADVALMAQNEIGAVRLAGGGSSSAMAHKSNPVGAEVLVALARFNAGLAGTLHQAMVHENERSGAGWTLEWLTLPQMAVTTGAALRHAATLAANLTFVGTKPA